MIRLRIVLPGTLLITALASALVAKEDDAKEGAPPDDAAAAAESESLTYTILLLRDPSAQADLRLTSDQSKSASPLLGAIDVENWRLRNVSAKERLDSLGARLAEFRRGIAALLRKDQQTRLEQLVLQARGAAALAAPDVADRLALKESQIAKIKEIFEPPKAPEKEASSGAGAKGATGTAPTSTADKTTTPEARTKKILAVLNAKQHARLVELAGPTFDFSLVRQIYCSAPELTGATAWLNTEPLALANERGKVVIVHFFASDCINCVHNIPCYQRWQKEFAEKDVRIIGIHTPEVKREFDLKHLKGKLKQHEVTYPVLVDNDKANWNGWSNTMWPTVYLVDKQGRVRAWWQGELNWENCGGEEMMRQRILALLKE